MKEFAGTTSSDLAKQAYEPVVRFPGGRIAIGHNSSGWFTRDPNAMAYTAAKYATVAKLIAGAKSALEIGCGDGFGAPIIQQRVDHLDCCDFYAPHVAEARLLWGHLSNTRFFAHDILDQGVPWDRGHEAIFALDVLEHIDPAQEDLFLHRVVADLRGNGIFICGMPTLASQEHASDHGRAGHINCQTPGQITETLKGFFDNVLSFGLADGQINLGFEPMRQYQLNVCTGPRR